MPRVIGESNSRATTGKGRVHVPPVDAQLSSAAAALIHFDLRFQNGDHKINTIEAGSIVPGNAYNAPDTLFKPGPSTRHFAAFRDRNGDDDFTAQVGWLNLSHGRSYVEHIPARSDGRLTRNGQAEFWAPVPRQAFAADHELVLHGFSLRRPEGTDANVRAFGLRFATLNRNPAFEVLLSDDSGADTRTPIEALISYAWIPRSLVARKGTVGGSATGRRDGRPIPAGYAVMTGFRFEFLNSDHHLLRVMASTRDGGMAHFQDNNADDPVRWSIDYALLGA
jgi:hypothetical protein